MEPNTPQETNIAYCMNCGGQLPPGATFCPNCGRKTEPYSNSSSSDASGENAAGEAAPPVSGQVVQSECGAPDGIESYLNYAIVITILALFNCGSIVNLVLGIVALVYASKVDKNLLAGDRTEAEACAQTARMLCFIATGVIVLQLLLVLLAFFAILFCAILPILLQ